MPVPTTAERPAPGPPDVIGGPSLASTLIVWFATASAAMWLVFAAPATDLAVAAQFSHVEVAEEAGPTEESTATERRNRTDTRGPRRRLREAKVAQRWIARTNPWIALLVVPTSYASRRGPPSLTV